MPLLYFHLRDGHDVLLDPEGREFDGHEAIAAVALAEARAIISDEAIAGRINLDQHIESRTSSGTSSTASGSPTRSRSSCPHRS